MAEIELNNVSLDWVTLTSFNGQLRRDMDRIARLWRASYRDSRKLKTGNYTGELMRFDKGSIYIGDGVQKGRTHSMVQVSSSLASVVMGDIVGMCEKYARCTRIDVQSSVIEPVWWCQWEFLHWARANSYTVGFYSSWDMVGKLETVYLGSRKSDKFSRVYEKPLADGRKALRFETQYSGKRADALMGMLSSSDDRRGLLWGVLSGEHKRVNHHKLGLTMPYLRKDEIEPIKVKVSARVKGDSERTDDWLVDRVLPTLLKRVASGDESSDELFRRFWDGLKIARVEANEQKKIK